MKSTFLSTLDWRNRFLLLLSLAIVAFARQASADAFSDYAARPTFNFPSSTITYDVLPDGRLIAVSTFTVYRETAAGSRSFTTLGTLAGGDPSSCCGAAFVRVSPDGTKIAVGNNGGATFDHYQVGAFALSSLAGTWFTAGHFDAQWVDNRYIALSAGVSSPPGAPSIVTILDSSSSDATNPANPTVVNNIGGASGGIAFDASGNLFTANGYQYGGPSLTGEVREVPASSWQAARTGGPIVNFETQAVPIVHLLSASPIRFDAPGNLLVGGGDAFSATPDANYFAIVRATAVAQARTGGGLIDTSDPNKVRKLDPDPTASSTYAVAANPARNEIYVVSYGSAQAFTYGFTSAAAPALPVWGLALLAASLVWVERRRALRA